MIRTLTKFLVPGAALLALAPAAMADGRNPGSVLIFPIHQSGPLTANGMAATYFTAVSVTNTALQPATPGNLLGGTTNIHWEYANTIPDLGPNGVPALPLDCFVTNLIEPLTPADTRSVLTGCHNGGFFGTGMEGYLVVSAQNPNVFGEAWAHDYLIGSELVLNSSGGVYSLNAIPFEAGEGIGEHNPTDVDGPGGLGDGQLDFDGVEYEGIADNLYMDVFYAIAQSNITLINMTGGFQHRATVKFDVWNDNEKPLSATLAFKCWVNQPLAALSLVFNDVFLANNTVNDPAELDTTCDGVGDTETGWARIRGLNASSTTESIPNPALLGAITAGIATGVDGGHLLWESGGTKQFNGDFYKTGSDDPEFP